MGKKKKHLAQPKKITITPEEINSLYEKIRLLEEGYLTAKQHFTDGYNQFVYPQETVGSEATYEQFLEITTLVPSLYASLMEEPRWSVVPELLNRKYLLEIKLIIMRARFGLATVEKTSPDHNNIIQDFLQAILCLQDKIKEISFKHDEIFQEEISLAFTTIRSTLEGNDDSQKKARVKLSLSANLFADKCSDGFIKLYEKFFYLMTPSKEGKLNLFLLPPDAKTDFLALHATTYRTLKSHTDVASIFKLASAHLLAYQFEFHSRPHSPWKMRQMIVSEDTSTVLTLLDSAQLKAYFKLADELREKYIAPAMASLLSADMTEMVKHAEIYVGAEKFFKDWSSTLTLHINTYKFQEQQLTDEQKLPDYSKRTAEEKIKHRKKLRKIERKILQLEWHEAELIDAMNRFYRVRPDFADVKLIEADALYAKIKRRRLALAKEERRDLQQALALSQQAEDVFQRLFARVMKEDLEKKQKKCAQLDKADEQKDNEEDQKDADATEKNNTDDEAEKKDADADESTDTDIESPVPLSPFEQARLHFSRQQWQDAATQWQLAATEAADEEDWDLAARSHDGLVSISATNVLSSITKLHSKLNFRLSHDEFLSEENRQKILALFTKIDADFAQVLSLHENYVKLLDVEAIKKNPPLAIKIKHTQADLFTVFNEIRTKIKQTVSIYKDLSEQGEKERHRYLLEQGKIRAQRLKKGDALDETELLELGRKEFADQGKAKRKKQKTPQPEKSDISKKLQFIKDIKSAMDHLEELTTQLPAQTTERLPRVSTQSLFAPKLPRTASKEDTATHLLTDEPRLSEFVSEQKTRHPEQLQYSRLEHLDLDGHKPPGFRT